MLNTDNFASNILRNLGLGLYLIDTNMNLLWFNNEINNWFINSDKYNAKGKCYEVIFSKDRPCNNCPVIRLENTGNVELSVMQISSIDAIKNQYRLRAKK